MDRKRLIFLSVLTILIAISGLYATYAINVFLEEDTTTEYDMALNFDLSESVNKQLNVAAGKTKLFDIDITNNFNDSVKYGIVYSLDSLTTLPEGVIVAKSSTSKSDTTGLVSASSTTSVSIVVVNGSTSNVTISFSVINGYKNGGELIIPNSNNLITEIYDVSSTAADITIANLGLSVTEGTPNFNNTSCSSECDETTVGLFESEDDLGTSYYFRGDPTNNYVKFGKNSSNQDMYWRIIRINGDGTIRMIYMGTDVNATELTTVGYSNFNNTETYNTYIGYMYGDTGQTTYASTHSNKYDSLVKKFLEGTGNNDGWYYENIVATGYHDYVADAIYCNDRSLSSGDGVNRKSTEYGAYGRLTGDIVSPTLKCNLADYTNDKFTYGSELGNGLLRYPVGLITADEVVMAGAGYDSPNTKVYLHSSDYYWTMSPFAFIELGYDAKVFSFGGGKLNGDIAKIGADYVLPVISLKANAIIDGSGIVGDPFVVEE